MKNPQKLGELHWDLAYYFHDRYILDSAFYHYYSAYKLFSERNENNNMANMLLNMAILQEKINDHIGSEVSTIQALSLIEDSNDYALLYRIYNTLAIINNGLKDYNKSLEYHFLAEKVAKQMNDSILQSRNQNNIGVVYKNLGDFENANRFYQVALNIGEIRKNAPELYAKILDNQAYAEFHLDYEPEVFYPKSCNALQLRDSLNDIPGKIINHIHLGEFDLAGKDTSSSKNHFLQAYEMAKNTRNLEYRLESLLWLSKVDEQAGKSYLENYIALSDSLKHEERLIQNKFARIRFETDKYIEEAAILSGQKIWISIVAAVTALGLLLLYLFSVQRARNRELSLEKDQQKANEKIYKLLLKQQIKLEEGRQEERARISRELHDGVLGKLFGTRMNFGLLKEKSVPLNGEQDKLLEELQNIEEEIRDISHNLISQVGSENRNFQNLVKELVAQIRKHSPIKIKLHFSDSLSWDSIDEEAQINLYRILQEALHNIIKHSKATKARVCFLTEDENLLLKIEDNGRGFDSTKKFKGIGLRNMKTRIEKIDGNLEIDSGNKGTTFIFRLKLKEIT
ncbi:ATP-binding protein [Salegentibacter sp. HM20]